VEICNRDRTTESGDRRGIVKVTHTSARAVRRPESFLNHLKLPVQDQGGRERPLITSGAVGALQFHDTGLQLCRRRAFSHNGTTTWRTANTACIPTGSPSHDVFSPGLLRQCSSHAFLDLDCGSGDNSSAYSHSIFEQPIIRGPVFIFDTRLSDL